MTVPGTSASSGIPGLSTEQWKSLLNIVQNQANSDKLFGKIVIIWIFDSGCSHHMIGRRDLLMNLQPISPHIIGLPNGTKAVALELGTICVGQNFIIRNVLYIPKLTCNLLSFNQLLDESKYFITLSNSMFVVYDLISRMQIGVAK